MGLGGVRDVAHVTSSLNKTEFAVFESLDAVFPKCPLH